MAGRRSIKGPSHDDGGTQGGAKIADPRHGSAQPASPQGGGAPSPLARAALPTNRRRRCMLSCSTGGIICARFAPCVGCDETSADPARGRCSNHDRRVTTDAMGFALLYPSSATIRTTVDYPNYAASAFSLRSTTQLVCSEVHPSSPLYSFYIYHLVLYTCSCSCPIALSTTTG